MHRRKIIIAVVSVIVVIAIWNFPASYQIGVDGEVFVKKIPLYAKICGFFYRDYMYKDIVGEIVSGIDGDKAKVVLGILKWTKDNIILKPSDKLRIVDDHPLNIIIRQYGSAEQLEDVFTILCGYAGFKAIMHKLNNPDASRRIVLSFVNIDGRWVLFNAAKGKYFYNSEGRLASVEDFIVGRVTLDAEESAYYGPYLGDLKNVSFTRFTRADEQMPFRRPAAEAWKAIYGLRDVGSRK